MSALVDPGDHEKDVGRAVTNTRRILNFDAPLEERRTRDRRIVQTAIPWCVEHDMQATHDWRGDIPVCHRQSDVPPDCQVSTGGPDHKWWQDT